MFSKNVLFHLKLSSAYLLLTEWFCVPLWREAVLGGPGEEGVLLDPAGISSEHPHLLLVEKNGLANTAI